MPDGPDPLRYFRLEARELIDQISAGVLDLDQEPGTDLVNRLLRFAHTLKGAARVVKQQDIADRAHEFEEVLVPHRGHAEALPADEMRELLRLNDEIAAYVSALEEGPAPEPATDREAPASPPVPSPAANHPATSRPAPNSPAPARPALNSPAPDRPAANHPAANHPAVTGPAPESPQRPGPPADEASPPRAATADLDELLDAIGEANARIAPLRDGGRAMSRLQRSAETLVDQLRIRRTALAEPAGRAQVQRLAGELAALGRRLTDSIDQIERELDEVRGRAEGLRLVGAGTIFTVLHRAVRDAADAEGKRVRFVASGAEIRMGPHLLNQISGAFLHVVRNAVVHGIEPAEARLAAGKPAEGTVSVSVQRRGRYAIIRCTDDGRGFDLDALRRTARERGLLAESDPDPDPDRLIGLVLRGGISTSPAVTDVAGRGIGMDVARDVADQLGGEVAIRSEPGGGSTVELVVPLTLLSMNGLIVQAGPTVATVPLDAVRKCVRLNPEEASIAATTGRLAHDDAVVPFLPLARTLHAGPAVPDTAARPVVAVVVCADDVTVAVGVDRLAGTSTLVARPLPDLAPAAAVIGSVAIDLDGNPRLVLDPHGLVAEARRGHGVPATGPGPVVPPLPILVVDDSLTTRMLERSILESAGYEVDLAASGEEGLEKARAREYGLFLTDIDMPGIDGFTFVAQTRADPALAGVPAILVSSRAGGEDRRRGADVGASAYVVKGEFDQEELLGHIRRLIHS